MSDAESKPTNRLKGLLIALLVIGSLVALFFIFDVNSALRDIISWIEGLGPAGPLILIAFYVVACVLLIPGSILTLGAGLVFGLIHGYVYVTIGSVLGATAAFLVGRTLARGRVQRRLESNPKFQAIDRAVASKGWKIVFLTRLSPVFPFTLQNYMYGITGISLGEYVLASWIGMIPGTVMYVYLGSAAETLADATSGGGGAGQKVLFGVGLLATLAVTIYVTKIARTALRETIRSDDPEPVKEGSGKPSHAHRTTE